MKRGTVMIPHGGNSYMRVPWHPRWGESGEVPLYTIEYAEADLVVFGSGTVELRMLELPIVSRLPIKPRGGYPHKELPWGHWRELLMALRKITPSQGSPGGGGPGVSDMKTWPTLVEYLSTTKYPDGQDRVPSSLVILCDANGWKGCLSDKDNGRSLWKTASALEELLLSLEEAAASDDPSHWRQSAESKWKGKKKS